MRVFAITVLGILLLLPACQGERDTTPEDQQLARINRELAALQVSVGAMPTRLKRLEGNAGTPIPAIPASPHGPPNATSTSAPSNSDSRVGSSVATNPNALNIDVSHEYQIDGKVMSETQLLAALKAYAARTSPAQALISAQSGSTHEMIVRAIDLAKQSGIEHFALDIDSRGPPAPEMNQK